MTCSLHLPNLSCFIFYKKKRCFSISKTVENNIIFLGTRLLDRERLGLLARQQDKDWGQRQLSGPFPHLHKVQLIYFDFFPFTMSFLPFFLKEPSQSLGRAWTRGQLLSQPDRNSHSAVVHTGWLHPSGAARISGETGKKIPLGEFKSKET